MILCVLKRYEIEGENYEKTLTDQMKLVVVKAPAQVVKFSSPFENIVSKTNASCHDRFCINI